MTDRSPEIQKMLDQFSEDHGITKDERDLLDRGSSHDFDCRCEVCRKWWKAVGPEEGPNGELTYGPFTKDEIERP
jgi:hypothetical protein